MRNVCTDFQCSREINKLCQLPKRVPSPLCHPSNTQISLTKDAQQTGTSDLRGILVRLQVLTDTSVGERKEVLTRLLEGLASRDPNTTQIPIRQ